MINENYLWVKRVRKFVRVLFWLLFALSIVIVHFFFNSVLNYVLVLIFWAMLVRDNRFPDTLSIDQKNVTVKFPSQTLTVKLEHCCYFVADLSYAWMPFCPRKIIVLAFIRGRDSTITTSSEYLTRTTLDRYPCFFPIGINSDSRERIIDLFQELKIKQTRPVVLFSAVITAVMTVVGIWLGCQIGDVLHSLCLLFQVDTLDFPLKCSCSLLFGSFFSYLTNILVGDNSFLQNGKISHRLDFFSLACLINYPALLLLTSISFQERVIILCFLAVFLVTLYAMFLTLNLMSFWLNKGKYVPPPFHKIFYRKWGEVRSSWEGGMVCKYESTF